LQILATKEVKMTEEETYRYLTESGIISITDCQFYLVHYVRPESLADIAERLWEKACMECCLHLILAMRQVYEYQYGLEIKRTPEFIDKHYLFTPDSGRDIATALIALQRAGVEI
jgi:hypothetical protein